MSGGHYTAYIKNANEKWYEFNDTSVREISENSVISSYSYFILLDRSCDFWEVITAPLGLRNFLRKPIWSVPR